jgi:exonuclease III
MVETVKKSMDKDHSIYSGMNICTYNIVAGGANRLEQAMRCMRTMNIDIGLITETKLQGYHTTLCEGYDIVATKAKSKHQGGVALCYRKSDYFHVEGTRTFGPNVIRATLVSGRKKWRLVGVYIPPGEEDGSTLECAQAAAAVSSDLPLILLGDLNADLKCVSGTGATTNDSLNEVAALVASLAAIDLNQQFLQRRGIGDWTWSMRREGRRIFSRCDYILATDPNNFRAFRIKNPRYESDHRMLVGILRTDSKRQHRRYVNKRARYSLQIRSEDKSRADHLMEELTELIEKPARIDQRYESWISANSWKLVDAKAEARRCGDAQAVSRLKVLLRKSLKADRKCRIDAVAAEIDNLLETKQVQAAYGILRRWYREKPGHVPKPTIQNEEKTRSEYQELFTAEDPPGEPIPIHVTPSSIDDSPPTDKEVCEALKRMKHGKTPGGSGIRVEHLTDWMKGAQPGEFQNEEKVKAWNKVLELVKLAFTGEPLPRTFGIGILVLIPKGEPDQFRGIALLEVIYKLVSTIINTRLTEEIKFHDAVHGFCRGRGTNTAIIEAKLRMQLAQRTTKPRYFVFLDLKKAYDTLDRRRTLEILKGYGVGDNVRSFIQRIWDMDTMVPKQAGFYGKPFSASRGVRQGDVMSPIIFNIIADAVIRHCEARISEGREMQRLSVDALFYADDGVLTGEDPDEVQLLLDIYTGTFARVGLKMNAGKTKAMIMNGGNIRQALSMRAYCRRVEGVGESHRERSLQKVKCELCGVEVNRQHLKTHQTRSTCITGRKDYQATLLNQVAELSPDPPESMEVEGPISEYSVSMDGLTETLCPVANCPYRQVIRGRMRKHFRARHIWDTIIVEEEGRLPRCVGCGLFQRNVGLKHQQTADCIRWTKTRKDRETDKVNKETVAETVFYVQDVPIETVMEFKYLGRVVKNDDGDWPAVIQNVKKATATWGRICRILSKEGANPKAMASIYKAVVQAVLLYGSESWVLTQSMEKKLQSFHRRCARYITGQHIRQNPDESWTCPSSEAVLSTAGLWSIQEYIQRRRSTVKKYVQSKFIYRQCEESRPLASNPNQIVWWKPDEVVNLLVPDS